MTLTESITTRRSSRRRASLMTRLSNIVPALLGLLGILIVWELAVRLLGVSSYILPAPTLIITSLVGGLADLTLLEHAWVTFSEVILGYVVGSLIGIASALVVTRWRIVDRTMSPLIVAVQAVPKVALAPLLLTWFGFGMPSKVVLTALMVFFPVFVNLIVGLKSADDDRLDLMRSIRASQFEVFKTVRFPSALPYLFAGLDVAIILGIIGAVVSEFVGSTSGLGYLILVYNTNLNVAGSFAAMAVLAAMGLGLSLILHVIRDRIVFWQPRDEQSVNGI
jgi:NitT/TauT family transport system permease protein